jgi:hypothetical protein
MILGVSLLINVSDGCVTSFALLHSLLDANGVSLCERDSGLAR